MEETILKRCLSTPTKPPAKRAATFASTEKLQENYSSPQNSTAGQTTSQALTEVDLNRRHFQAEPHRCCHENHANNLFNSSLEFTTGIEICESELLLYSLLAVAFPDNSFRARYHEKYLNISSAIENVFHVHFGSRAISNYLYRANNNLRRDLGKVSGILRWKYYREKIERIVASHSSTLQGLISSRDSNTEASRTTVTDLRKLLTQECSKRSKNSAAESMNEDTGDTFFETKFIENFDIAKFPNWKQCFNAEEGTAHLFYFGGKSIGYFQIEIIIDSSKVWKIRLEGRENERSVWTGRMFHPK